MADNTTRLVPAGGVVTPRMRRLLLATLVLFALLSVDSIYLSSITLMEWITGEPRQNAFYLWMFLGHLVLGLAITLPAIAFGAWHWKRSHHHPNRRAVRMGHSRYLTRPKTRIGTTFWISASPRRAWRPKLPPPRGTMSPPWRAGLIWSGLWRWRCSCCPMAG